MNYFNKLKEFLNYRNYIQQSGKQIQYSLQHDKLIEKALNSHEKGISTDLYCKNEIIVSLTTYGKRLYDVATTIESIMQGSLKPNRIVLWLGDEMRAIRLPITLLNQQKRGLEINYCKDIRSYKKLIPTLKKYPEATIITIDDDVLYHYDLVEKMVNEHQRYPNHIIANRIHKIKLNNKGKPLKYMDWKFNDNPTDDSPLNFWTGVGGVLYPPQSLHPEVLNESVFMDICKYADDIWFYAMARKAGTKARKCYTHNDRGEDYLINLGVQDVGLFNINTGIHGKNDVQLLAVFEKYNLFSTLK